MQFLFILSYFHYIMAFTFHQFSCLFYCGPYCLYSPLFGFIGSLFSHFFCIFLSVLIQFAFSSCVASQDQNLSYCSVLTANTECLSCPSLVFLGDVDNPHLCLWSLFITFPYFLYLSQVFHICQIEQDWTYNKVRISKGRLLSAESLWVNMFSPSGKACCVFP